MFPVSPQGQGDFFNGQLGVSLATGGYFLGKLKVNRALRVGVMSGESGLPTLQESLRRISRAAGHRLADISGLIVSPCLPRFGHIAHEDAIRKFITDDELEALAIDPAYLCIDDDGSAGNLFAQGAKLRGITEVCQSVGAQLIICHHTKRTIVDPFAPPELEHIAWAGWQEWARQWLLLGRRERYEPGSGLHRLWLNVGGSAGHSALWAADIREGVYDGITPRNWEVELLPAADARQQSKESESDRRQQAKDQTETAKLDAAKLKLVSVARKFPSGETLRELELLAGLNHGLVKKALAALLVYT